MTARREGDLSVTARYTSAAWAWGGLPCADLLVDGAARRAFFVANGVLELARWFAPRLGSLRHDLLHRHAMIDRLVRDTEADQVLELAAGLSNRGAAFSARPEMHYVEVDLPAVVGRKRRLLGRSVEGRRILARRNFLLVEGDVGTFAWEDLVDPARRLCIVAEGLLVYLEPAARRALWRRASRLLDRVAGGGLVFDLVPDGERPDSGLTGRLLSLGMHRATRGRGFARDGQGRQDVERDLRDCGFRQVTCHEASRVARDWDLPHADEPTRQLVFCASSSG